MGGVVFIGSCGDFTFINSNVFNSSASTKGGAVYVKPSGDVKFNNVNITNAALKTSSDGFGAALFIGHDIDTVTMKRSV